MAMFANWGTIMFLVSVVPLSKFVEVRLELKYYCYLPHHCPKMDLRKTVVLVSGLIAVGSVLRCGRAWINNKTIFLARYSSNIEEIE